MLGLEDHELRAHIDLQERRQQSIKRTKLASPPDSTKIPSSKARSFSLAVRPEKLVPSPLSKSLPPPPPYQPKHIEYAKMNKGDSSVNEITNAVTISESKGRPPPYTSAPISHRTRRPPQSQLEASHTHQARARATSVAGIADSPSNDFSEASRLASLTEEDNELRPDDDNDRRLSSSSEDSELADFEYLLVFTDSRDGRVVPGGD